jgi:hypothetical protein
MPEAMAANAILYVSAVNSQYANSMSGPQVVEVVVIERVITEPQVSCLMQWPPTPTYMFPQKTHSMQTLCLDLK